MAEKRYGRVTTVETNLEIIEALRDINGAGVTELATHLGRNKSTVYRHLNTLHEQGYVIREGNKYLLGQKFLGLGSYVQRQKKVYRFAGEKVRELSEATNERAQFIVEDHGMGVYLFKENGKNAVNIDSDVGSRINLHVAAAGKAILAHLPEEKLEWILDTHGLQARTDSTITTREQLYSELEAIREQGYAFNIEEYTAGLHSVGAAVLGDDGTVYGALSVAAPANRMRDGRLEKELPELLMGATNEIELKHKYES